MAAASQKNKANFRPAEGVAGEKKGGRWSWWQVASRRRVTWRPAVGRTAGSGDPRRTSECEKMELAVMEKRQNKANLLVVLIIDMT